MAQDKPLVVIVPGAFHAADAYPAFTSLLHSAGYETLTVPLLTAGPAATTDPEATHFDDARAIEAQLLPLLDSGREAVFVSHSYGSMPSTEAIAGQTVGERKARGLVGGVTAFVVVAGFAFSVAGKNLFGTEDELPLMPYHRLEKGLLHLDESTKPLFFSDLPPAEQDAAFAGLTEVHTRKTFTTFPAHTEAELTGLTRKVWVLTELDRTNAPQWQEGFIRAGRFDEVVRLPAGHSPFLSMPERLVEVVRSVHE